MFVYFCIIVLLVKSIGALSFQRTSLKRGTAAELSQPLLHRLPDRKYPLREVPGFASSMIDSSIKLGVSERLQKVIARAGIASRRMAENMVWEVFSCYLCSE